MCGKRSGEVDFQYPQSIAVIWTKHFDLRLDGEAVSSFGEKATALTSGVLAMPLVDEKTPSRPAHAIDSDRSLVSPELTAEK